MKTDTIENAILSEEDKEIGRSVRQEQMVRFQQNIDSIASQGVSYIDAVVEYCEENDMDIDMVISIIPQSLKRRIMQEAEELNLVKGKTMRLFG